MPPTKRAKVSKESKNQAGPSNENPAPTSSGKKPQTEAGNASTQTEQETTLANEEWIRENFEREWERLDSDFLKITTGLRATEAERLVDEDNAQAASRLLEAVRASVEKGQLWNGTPEKATFAVFEEDCKTFVKQRRAHLVKEKIERGMTSPAVNEEDCEKAAKSDPQLEKWRHHFNLEEAKEQLAKLKLFLDFANAKVDFPVLRVVLGIRNVLGPVLDISQD